VLSFTWRLLSSGSSFFLCLLAFSLALFQAAKWFGYSFFVRITEVLYGGFWRLNLLSYLHIQLISGGFPVTARKEHILVVNWLAFAGFLF